MKYIDVYESNGIKYWSLQIEDRGGVYTTPVEAYGESCIYEHNIPWESYIESRLAEDYSDWNLYEGGVVEDMEELESLDAAIASYYEDGDNMTDKDWAEFVDNNR